MHIVRPAKLDIICLVTGFVLLLLLVVTIDKPPHQDEVPYLSNIPLLHHYGLSREFLLELKGSAGPLYTLVHFLFEPLTNLQAPGIRLVNIFFLLAMMVVLAILLKDLGWTHWSHTFFTLAIPKIYVLTGLALTEMPAMFCYSASLLLLIRSSNQKLEFSKRVMVSILGGICLSLAILGRQPYLLTLGAVPLLFFSQLSARSVLIMICFFLAALILPVIVFSIWEGLIPPGDLIYYPATPRRLNVKFDFFILSLFYIAFSFLIITPATFKIKGRKELYIVIAMGIFATILNFTFDWINYLPANYIMYKFPEALLPVFEHIFGSISLWVAIYFLYKISRPLFRNTDFQILFILASMILLCVASAKITWGFSSRYAAQAVPLIILGTAYFYKFHRRHYLWLVPAIMFGLVAIVNYYK